MENVTQITQPEDMHELCIWAQDVLLGFDIDDIVYVLAFATIDLFKDYKEVHIPSIDEAEAMCNEVRKSIAYRGKSRIIQLLTDIIQEGKFDVGYWVHRSFEEALNPTTI